MRLLIVDDDVIAVRGMLSGIDFPTCGIDGEPEVAYDAQQAMSRMTAGGIDVMLCDIEMPGQSGIDLLRQVRRRHPDVACVFLTCHAKFEYAREAIELGCSDYILKPAPYDRIANAISRVTANLRMQRQMQQYGAQWLSEQHESAAKAQGDTRSARDIAQDTCEYILQNLGSEELSVSLLARRSFLNEDYLNRVFKRETGESLNQYIIKQRMALAARLLENPGLSLNTIAGQVGYANYPYFVASFKKTYGCSPSEYRKSPK